MRYIDRYMSGDYQQTWQDIASSNLEEDGGEKSTEALEVAREIMKRVRQNIEILIHRLQEIKFSFGYDALLHSYLSLPSTLSCQAQYLEAFSWVRKQYPVFLPANLEDLNKDIFDIDEFIQQNNLIDQKGVDRSIEERNEYTSTNEHKGLLSSFPLSMRAWYEQVGGVNFYGFHPRWTKEYASEFSPSSIDVEGNYLMNKCDFLMIAPLADARVIAQHNVTIEHEVFEFAPDQHEKCYLAGGKSPYRFLFPNPQADFFLPRFSWSQEASLSFVDYLRTSLLTWAGFPGMATWPKVPEEDLAFLTKNLTPF